jgi:GNAT superfamily N-acetyltransferase
VELTRGTPDQIEELRPLWLELFRHHREVGADAGRYTDEESSWRHRASLYREWLAQEPSFVLIARAAGGDALGYALVHVHPPDAEILDTWLAGELVAELETLVVTAGARGTGVGSALLDGVEAELLRLGVADYAVGVLAGNDEARRLSESRGFKPQMLRLAQRLGDA